MAKKTNTKKTTAADQPLKFTKGGFYLDHAEDLWFCTSGKTKQVNDTQTVVLMKATEAGEPVGNESEQLIESFTRQLTGAELKEYRAVCQREADAENATQTGEADPGKKPAKTKKDTNPAKDKKMSALDAAAKVLGESKQPMASKAMIEAMSAKGYWTSPGGQTPHATLYAAILREINVKGAESRFQKTDKGRFALAAK